MVHDDKKIEEIRLRLSRQIGIREEHADGTDTQGPVMDAIREYAEHVVAERMGNIVDEARIQHLNPYQTDDVRSRAWSLGVAKARRVIFDRLKSITSIRDGK